jgi:hypothetical protein
MCQRGEKVLTSILSFCEPNHRRLLFRRRYIPNDTEELSLYRECLGDDGAVAVADALATRHEETVVALQFNRQHRDGGKERVSTFGINGLTSLTKALKSNNGLRTPSKSSTAVSHNWLSLSLKSNTSLARTASATRSIPRQQYWTRGCLVVARGVDQLQHYTDGRALICGFAQDIEETLAETQ